MPKVIIEGVYFEFPDANLLQTGYMVNINKDWVTCFVNKVDEKTKQWVFFLDEKVEIEVID